MKPITLTTGFSIFDTLCLQQPDLGAGHVSREEYGIELLTEVFFGCELRAAVDTSAPLFHVNGGGEFASGGAVACSGARGNPNNAMNLSL